MNKANLRHFYAQYDLEDKLGFIQSSSPYAYSVLEKYHDLVGAQIQSGEWEKGLDYSSYPQFPILPNISQIQSDAECMQSMLQFRNLHSARILWHDLNDLAHWQTIFKAQSDLADLCTRYVLQYLEYQFSTKYETPVYTTGEKMNLCVVAMGKWGGQELNFSSDIDFLFVYGESGEVEGRDGRRALSHHEFFTKMAQRFLHIIGSSDADGFVYRCDTRLRPFGDSGSLVVNLAALEQYLVQHGREWERYAYLKARCVTGDETVQQEFFNLQRPFVYRRYFDYGVFAKLRDMHAQIAKQVKQKAMLGNLKLGRGGIRECEFLVQVIQLLRGGRQKDLQQRNFYAAYSALQNNEVWLDSENKLIDAYIFLRVLENRLQALHQQQTHQLPESQDDRNALLAAMKLKSWDSLMTVLNMHRQHVQFFFDQELSQLGINLDTEKVDMSWLESAQNSEFIDEQTKAGLLQFGRSRAYLNLSENSRDSLDRLLAKAFSEIESETREKKYSLKETSFATQNFMDVIQAVGRRAVYFELLLERPSALTHLLTVCFKSDYLCQQIARQPILLDELLDARVFEHVPGREEVRSDTLAIFDNSNELTTEELINDLVTNKHLQSFRIAAAEIFNRLPLMKVSDCLSDLAESSLQVVFSRVFEEVLEKFEIKNLNQDNCGFVIVAYGKLGGLELSYTSDLDLVFLYDPEQLPANSELRQDKSMLQRFYMRLGQQIIRFLDTPTTMGRLYEIDTRLRPSGHSGFLVSSFDGFEQYQLHEAWTWEHQALTRSRVVLGSESGSIKFQAIRNNILHHAVDQESLKTDIIKMRDKMRMQFNKDNPQSQQFHLKHSPGGMIDLEFLVQYLVLLHAREKPEIAFYSDNIRQLEALTAANVLSGHTSKQLITCYIALREKAHRLSLQSEKPFVPSDQFLSEREVIKQAWAIWLAKD